MNEKIVSTIKSLMQLDHDAIQAYDQALENIDVREIHVQMTSFRDDHERHIRDWSKLLKDNAYEVPERKRDVKGFLIEGFTAVRSATGTEGALKAMQTNEKLTNSRYEAATKLDNLTPEVRKVVEAGFRDEQKHMRYIEQVLREKKWVSSPAAPR